MKVFGALMLTVVGLGALAWMVASRPTRAEIVRDLRLEIDAREELEDGFACIPARLFIRNLGERSYPVVEPQGDLEPTISWTVEADFGDGVWRVPPSRGL